MFNNLRTSGHTILTRIMLLFIVCTFALWGIGDIFRSSGRDMNVAKVGDVSISLQDYGHAIKNRQEEMRQRLGRLYSPELVKKLGLESQALDGIVNRLLLRQEAVAQGIVVGEDSIIEFIATAPQFKDGAGKFSKETYEATLRGNRMTEKEYINVMSEQIASKLLLGTVASGITAPEDLAYALYRTRAEKRKAALLTVPPSVAGKDYIPTEADIKTYYESNSGKYLVPEFRNFSYVELKPEDVKAGIIVGDVEIQKIYDERKDTFKQPERRVVEQVLFEKKEDAEKAHADIEKGKSLKDVAAAYKAINKDKLSLGELTREQVPVASAEVFSLQEGKYSKPVESPFGWHIMKVTKILPAGQKTLEEVRASIEDEIKSQSASEALIKLSNNFEDALGGGATFEEAAQKTGQKLNKVEAISHDGITSTGGKAELPAISNLLDIVFSTNAKDHSRMMQSDHGSYFMVQVNSIDKEHARPLPEVEAKVKQALVSQELDKRARVIADRIAKALKEGKKLEEAVAGTPVSAVFEPAGDLQRNSDTVEDGKLKGRVLTPELLKDLFTIKPKQFTAAYPLPEGGYMIGTVEQVIPAPDIVNEPKDGTSPLTAIRDELNKSLTNEVQYYYLQYLRSKYPVVINDRVLKSMTQENAQ